MGSYIENIMTLWINMFCITVSKIHKTFVCKHIYEATYDAPVGDNTQKYNIEIRKAYTNYDGNYDFEVCACDDLLAHAEKITIDDVDKIINAVKEKKPPMEIRKLVSKINLKNGEQFIDAADAAYVIKYDSRFELMCFEPDEWSMKLPEDKTRQRRYRICAEKAHELMNYIIEDNSPYWYALDMASLESNK